MRSGRGRTRWNPLCIVDTEAPHELERRLVLHPFGHRLDSEPASEVDDRVNEVLVRRVLQEIDDEVEVGGPPV